MDDQATEEKQVIKAVRDRKHVPPELFEQYFPPYSLLPVNDTGFYYDDGTVNLNRALVYDGTLEMKGIQTWEDVGDTKELLRHVQWQKRKLEQTLKKGSSWHSLYEKWSANPQKFSEFLIEYREQIIGFNGRLTAMEQAIKELTKKLEADTEEQMLFSPGM